MAGMASVAGSEALLVPTRRRSADAVLSANGTQSMAMQSVTDRLAALETGLMAQAAAVAAKRCGDPAWLWVPMTCVSCLVMRCDVCTWTERNEHARTCLWTCEVSAARCRFASLLNDIKQHCLCCVIFPPLQVCTAA